MKVVSLFAGCGGLDLGFIKAGHEIVFANDFDKDCKATYERNIGKHFWLGDVKKLDTSILPEYDILTGGFPCQGFSVANTYRNVSDSRNELYLQIVRIIGETQPKYFLAENVPGLLSLGKGKVAKMILEDFKNIGKNSQQSGYDVKMYLLNAANYGVPQGRKRVIFLGISNDIEPEKREILFQNFPPKETHSNRDNKLKGFKTLKEAIGDLPEPNTPKAKKIFNQIGNQHKVKINGYIGNRKLDWNKPGPTIVGRGGGTGGPVIAVHPNCERRFTVRETARIQTFPDDFEFLGSISSQFRQIGNAVAVDFAYHLGKVLKNFEDGKLKMKKGASKQLELTYQSL
jgi:DNA (cytosine-5)-methyltransferase 1